MDFTFLGVISFLLGVITFIVGLVFSPDKKTKKIGLILLLIGLVLIITGYSVCSAYPFRVH